ncbi:MAG: hypothetical protein AAFX58_13020 [Pseudomonadota bacterium]
MKRRTAGVVLALLVLSGCRDEAPGTAAAERHAEPAPADPCAGLEGFAALRCADPEVRQLDDDLARLVNRLAARSPHAARADVRAAQASWERDRNTCLGIALPKRRACLDAKYAERLADVRDALDDAQ